MQAVLFQSLVLCCLALVSGCASGSLDPSGGHPVHYQQTVDRMTGLTRGLELPEYFRDNPARRRWVGEFDVMHYFRALPHLSMQQGYVLDYVYHMDGMGGYPVLYVRKAAETPFATEQELIASRGRSLGDEWKDGVMKFIRTDMTEAGFFEWLLLEKLGRQFYLFWHALYYDVRIICDARSLQALLDGHLDMIGPLPQEVQRKARSIDVTPQITIHADAVLVEITTFTKWGGFFRERYTIKKAFPHKILKSEMTNLVEYDCGIMF